MGRRSPRVVGREYKLYGDSSLPASGPVPPRWSKCLPGCPRRMEIEQAVDGLNPEVAIYMFGDIGGVLWRAAVERLWSGVTYGRLSEEGNGVFQVVSPDTNRSAVLAGDGGWIA